MNKISGKSKAWPIIDMVKNGGIGILQSYRAESKCYAIYSVVRQGKVKRVEPN